MTITLLLLALKSLLVAAGALGLLRLTRARSAAERSTIAHLGLFALIALPLGSLALPRLALPVPAFVSQLATITPRAQPGVTRPIWRPATVSASAPTSPKPAVGAAATTDWPAALVGVARYAFLFPTLLLLALTLTALLRLVGLRARAEILVDPIWLGALARAQRRMGFKSGISLLRSDELESPVSWGVVRPVILLNHAAANAPEQAEAIIAHELAHVVQLDWVKLILARIATATFWFNPLAWLLAREAHQLREEAADDAVLAADIDGPDYAQLLIGVARHQCRSTLLGAHGVAPSKSSLGRRVRRVLDQNPARGASGRSWIAGFATGMLSMAVPLAAVTFVPGRTVLATVQTSGATPRTAARLAMVRQSPILAVSDTPDPAPNARKTNAPSHTIDLDATDAGDEANGDFPFDSAAGVNGQYRREMAKAGFPNLSTSQLAQAHAVDVTLDYARAMHAAGMSLGIQDLVEARAMGLDPSYIAAMRRHGINGTLQDYQGMRAVGVTSEFVGKLRQRGITITSPHQLTELRAVNDDPDP
jgi:bla regulator protein blaR1